VEEDVVVGGQKLRRCEGFRLGGHQ
jgi:hypothetical protein